MIKRLLGFFLLSTISAHLLAGVSVSIISKTDVKCYGASTGSATASVSGASGPTNYSWTPSFQNTLTATGLHAGVYTITVEDGSGPFKSTATTTVFIQEPVAPLNISTQTTSNVSCNGGNDGAATVNATGGWGSYNYFWTPTGGTTASATGLTALNYLVQVSDFKGCTKTASVNITQPSKLQLSVTKSEQPKCFGDKGGIYVMGSFGTIGSGYTYTWHKHDINIPAFFSGAPNYMLNLSDENYFVVVTDANNCTASASATIISPQQIQIFTTSQNVSCYGDSTAAVAASAIGGSGTPVYSWSTGATTNSLSGLMAGTYSLSVTDTNNCKKDTTITVIQPTSPLSVLINNVVASTDTLGNGSATAITSGGTPSYSYSWSNGETNAIATGLLPGIYTVTTTDVIGCTSTQTTSIQNAVGIIDLNESKQAFVYPNPANAIIYIKLPESEKSASVELYNSVGVLVKQQRFTNEVISLDLLMQPSGTYFLKIQTATQTALHKVSINK